MTVVPPPKLGLELEDEPWYSPDRWLNKGSVSNAITFVIMIIFIILKVNNDSNLAIDYGLAFGLFGFAVRSLQDMLCRHSTCTLFIRPWRP